MGRKSAITKKTLLGSAVIPLWVFAVQAALQGRLYVGVAAAAIATALFAAYEHLGIRSLPLDAEEMQALSEQLGEQVKEATDSGPAPGVTRDPETGQFQPADEAAEEEK